MIKRKYNTLFFLVSVEAEPDIMLLDLRASEVHESEVGVSTVNAVAAVPVLSAQITRSFLVTQRRRRTRDADDVLCADNLCSARQEWE